MRSRWVAEEIQSALRAGRERPGFRVVQYCIEQDHLHLIVEADDEAALCRGMQALSIRMARAVNRVGGGKGKVWAERFHARALKTPREVRNALGYVLNNERRHQAKGGHALPDGWVDPLSSGPWFDGWSTRVYPGRVTEDAAVASARTWLMKVGWKRHGLIGVDEMPGGS